MAPSNALMLVLLIACILVISVNLLMLLTFAINRSVLHTMSPLVASLAFADLMVGLSMVLTFFVPGPGTGMFAILAVIGSLMHLLVIAIDRCVSVLIPMTYQAKMTTRKTVVIIVLLWITVLGIVACPMLAARSVRATPPQALQLSLFLLTSALLVGLYSYLGAVALRHHRKIRRQVGSLDQEQYPGIPKATRVLIAVLGVYIVLWAPYFTSLLLVLTGRTDLMSQRLDFIGILLVDINSGVNFFIYGFMNESFRSAVIHTLKCKKARNLDMN
ncbi:hypothetical protein CAPTEDRAFT_201967 [Capitella teleta]|uniref:G-protein coupled receptors family 1 profile domain-containing protein n=1 Tax=Capitella teleta TaxID=283909 RepID=R7V116_CAPTE|nr:hypothetical protein CAPTEDRAFT_201967 [Capitella teleta]|eukprot:ELU09917.1 hypothetical protein CAPTEDRAFT_201967 [Capitella teleta]